MSSATERKLQQAVKVRPLQWVEAKVSIDAGRKQHERSGEILLQISGPTTSLHFLVDKVEGLSD